jgi:hypothetical protein
MDQRKYFNASLHNHSIYSDRVAGTRACEIATPQKIISNAFNIR